MNIRFKKIHLYNFQSFHEADVILDNQNYTIINGINNSLVDNAKSNGSGKSTIFSAISWVLTGETVNGAKDICNKTYADEGCLVSLDLVVDNKEYTITRTKDHKEYKTNLFIYIDGENKSGKGIRDSEKLLAEYLPDLTSSLIGSVIILGQGLPQKFTNNTPSGRKEVLEKLSKSDFMIEDLKARVSTRKAELASEQRNLEDCVLKSKTRLEMQNKRIAEADAYLNNPQNKSEIQSQIAKEEETLKKLDTEIDDKVNENNCLRNSLNEAYSQYNEFLSQINTKQTEIHDKYTEQMDDVRNSFAEKKQSAMDIVNEQTAILSQLKSELSVKQSEFVKLVRITDVCPVCKQKLIGVEKPDTTAIKLEIDDLKDKIDAQTAVVDKAKEDSNLFVQSEQTSIDEIKQRETEELNNYKQSIAEREQEFNAIIKELNTKVNNSTDEINALQKSKSKLTDEINKLKTVLSSIDSQIAYYTQMKTEAEADVKAIIDEIEVKNTELTRVAESVQINSKFNTLLTRDFRGYLLSDIITYIDNKAKEYCQIVFDNKNLKVYLNGNNIDIECQGKEYASLSGGEQQKVDLIIQFAIRDMLSTYLNFSCNIIALDEIMDFVDAVGCDNIINLVQEACKDVSSIFIITHHTELNLPCDNTISIVKSAEGISSIQ